MGFSGSSAGKESTCNAGELRFHSWVGEIPWRRDSLPTPVFLGFPGDLDSNGNHRLCATEGCSVSEDFRNAELMVEQAGHYGSPQRNRDPPGWIREGPMEGKMSMLSPGKLVGTGLRTHSWQSLNIWNEPCRGMNLGRGNSIFREQEVGQHGILLGKVNSSAIQHLTNVYFNEHLLHARLHHKHWDHGDK